MLLYLLTFIILKLKPGISKHLLVYFKIMSPIYVNLNNIFWWKKVFSKKKKNENVIVYMYANLFKASLINSWILISASTFNVWWYVAYLNIINKIQPHTDMNLDQENLETPERAWDLKGILNHALRTTTLPFSPTKRSMRTYK